MTSNTIGFDRQTQRFTDKAKEGDLALLPVLEGEFLIDDASRKSAAHDFGCVISRMPAAILRPRTHEDVARVVRFAAENGIGVTVRGQAHSAFGQAQSEHGVLIDMASLCTIHEVNQGHAVVDAGCTWGAVLAATLAAASSQRPIVLNGYTGLSVGGTLSVGGLSGMSHQCGCQVDHVLELLVVTGRGDLVVCSETQDRDLFEAVLAGQGQCGVIVRAKVALERAKSRTIDYTVFYPTLPMLLAAMQSLLEPARGFDLVWGGAFATPMGVMFPLFANKHYEPGEEAVPDTDTLFAGVPIQGMEAVDRTFMEYIQKIDHIVLSVPSGGGRRRPWADFFVGHEQVGSYAQAIFDSLAPDDWAEGTFTFFFPLTTSANTRPLLRLPNSHYAFLFDWLSNTNPIDDKKAEALIRRNREWYDSAIAQGGTLYPIGAVPMTTADWQRHYGDAWPAFERAKKKYDPAGILGAGLSIFGRGA